MKANVTIEQIWFNEKVRNFFFRTQSYKTLEELVYKSNDSVENTLKALDAQTENEDLDDFEEDLYNYSVEELADIYEIELLGEEENEEEI